MSTNPLIRPSELAAKLSNADTVVVDCRFNLMAPEAGRQAYMAAHLPTAVYADLDRDLARTPSPDEGRHPLPSPEAFALTLGALGIGNTSDVVVYDDQGGAIAARLWWLLRWVGHSRVAVLDGGLPAWTDAGYETTAGWVQPQTRVFDTTHVHSDWVVTTDELARAGAKGPGTLLDARTQARFEGREEPIDPIAGHVPGAVNWPFNINLDNKGQFVSPSQVSANLPPGVGAADSQVIAMCGSGVTACHLLLALELIGLTGKLYAGSWSEWIRDSARPIEPPRTEPL
jgi:thiosulfate/3-mercaptopyruvate sulfurtransferase